MSAPPEQVNSKNSWLQVRQPRGTFCELEVRTRVHLDAERTYKILTDPAHEKAFRGLLPCLERRVLLDNGQGEKVMEILQEGKWSFLFFGGSFPVRLLVTYSRNRGEYYSMRYKLLESPFMRNFDGEWRVRPFDPETHPALLVGADHPSPSPAPAPSQPSNSSPWSSNPLQAMHDMQRGVARALRPPSTSCYVTLQQTFQPVYVPPYPLDGYLRKITASVVEQMLEDVHAEAGRVQDEVEAQERRKRADRAKLFEALPWARVTHNSDSVPRAGPGPGGRGGSGGGGSDAGPGGGLPRVASLTSSLARFPVVSARAAARAGPRKFPSVSFEIGSERTRRAVRSSRTQRQLLGGPLGHLRAFVAAVVGKGQEPRDVQLAHFSLQSVLTRW